MDDFRELILTRIDQLEALAASAASDSSAVELDQARVGRLSRMDALQAQAMSVETGRRRRIQLTRLRAALARLDDGEFGDCVVCGEAIAEKRLQHDPGHTTCIECARRTEAR